LKFFIKILLLVFIAILLYIFIPFNTTKLIYIPKDDESIYYVSKLQNSFLNILDYKILRYLGINSGWIRLDKDKISRYELYKIASNPKRQKVRRVVVYGGESLYEISKKIAKQANLDSNKLLNLLNKLNPNKELLAKRYKLPYNLTEDVVAFYITFKSKDIFRKVAKSFYIDYPSKDFNRSLIVASIVEKETFNKKEKPIIAAVIYNRLKKDMKLQMDATLNYGKYSHTIVTPKMIRQDNSKFNTYKFKGLPPEPICAVTLSSLQAALNPDINDYLYFVKSKNGHKFSSDYKNHTKYVKDYKQNLAKIRAKKVALILKRGVKVNFPLLLPKVDTSFVLKKIKN